jgi:hypothetical protein
MFTPITLSFAHGLRQSPSRIQSDPKGTITSSSTLISTVITLPALQGQKISMMGLDRQPESWIRLFNATRSDILVTGVPQSANRIAQYRYGRRYSRSACVLLLELFLPLVPRNTLVPCRWRTMWYFSPQILGLSSESNQIIVSYPVSAYVSDVPSSCHPLDMQLR